nr:MAG TPA: hypothetical protein [Caudoviricetes sp.]
MSPPPCLSVAAVRYRTDETISSPAFCGAAHFHRQSLTVYSLPG